MSVESYYCGEHDARVMCVWKWVETWMLNATVRANERMGWAWAVVYGLRWSCNWFCFRFIFSLTLINIYMGKLQWMACGHYDLMAIITEWKQMIKRSSEKGPTWLPVPAYFGFRCRSKNYFLFFIFWFFVSKIIIILVPCYNYSGIRPSMGEH